jgi:hypothetical protein
MNDITQDVIDDNKRCVARGRYGTDPRDIPVGWRLVPIDPTQAMCQAGQDKAQEWQKFPLRINQIYQAMLSKSPLVKATPEGWHGHEFKEVSRNIWACECGVRLVDSQYFIDAVKSLDNLIFSCFAGIGLQAPDMDVYNKSFKVLELMRAMLSAISDCPHPTLSQPESNCPKSAFEDFASNNPMCKPLTDPYDTIEQQDFIQKGK